MPYVIRNGLLVPKRQVIQRKRSHLRVPHANIILRQPFFPIIRPAISAVAVDAVSTANNQSAVGTTGTHTLLTVGTALSNGALVFGVAWDSASVSSPTAHWDSTGTNQLMTLLGTIAHTSTGSGTVALFGLRNPTSGAHTFSTSWTTTAQAVMFGISFTGVDQTSDATAFKNYNSATGTSTAPSVTITSAVGDIPIGLFVNGNPVTDINSVNNTQLYLSTGVNSINSAMNRATGAASVAMSAVLSASDAWAAIGIDVAQVAGGGDTLLGQDQKLVMM